MEKEKNVIIVIKRLVDLQPFLVAIKENMKRLLNNYCLFLYQ